MLMLIFNTNLCYLCSQLLVSHRSISFFLFPIIRIHFPLCNRFWPVYSFFPFCFEKFNKLQLKFTNWNYLFFFLLHFWNIYYTMRNQDSWLLLFTGSVPRGVFVNIVHRKPGKPGAKSCECMISVHRGAVTGHGVNSNIFIRLLYWHNLLSILPG